MIQHNGLAILVYSYFSKCFLCKQRNLAPSGDHKEGKACHHNWPQHGETVQQEKVFHCQEQTLNLCQHIQLLNDND